jgi:orotidine-5'-phosphate decarboxylase
MTSYLERLGVRVAATRTALCLGIDPDPTGLPDGYPPSLAGVEAFVALLVEAAAPYASAIKPNLAFFEAFGAEGVAALERLRALLPADVPLIADAKRGDIGSTAARHAVAIFDRIGADAITASPYLGGEAIEPLLARDDRFVYVLCRTSNPGAGEFQDLVVAADEAADAPAEMLHLRVARRARAWSARFGTVGLVVGATAPRELESIRAVAPDLAFLVPGIGAQGGDEQAAVTHGRATAGPAAAMPGGGLLVNVSRGIAGAARHGGDPGSAIAAAAAEWSTRLRVLE